MRVSFTTTFTDNLPPRDPALEELKRWCKRFHEQGLTPSYEGSSLGNLSFRAARGESSFVITASQLELKNNLSAEAFVRVHDCSLDQKTVHASGTREPSSESILHFEIYKARSDINAIFHGHCAPILERAEEMGIPITRREEPFGSVALVQRVLEILDDHRFIIMRNHGFLSLDEDMESAGRLALRIHDNCSR